MTDSTSIGLASSSEPQAKRLIAESTRRPVVAALLSSLIPGWGHLLLQQRRKGTILIGLLVVLLFCFWPLRLLGTYVGFLGLYGSWVGLYIYGACSALLTPSRPALLRASRWWLILVLPVSVVSMALLGAALTRASGFRSFNVPSTSMEPTIRVGDHFVADVRYYQSRSPARQDLVIFKHHGLLVVKRVIGVGGDIVEEKEKRITLNGDQIDEPYAIHQDPSLPNSPLFGAEDWRRNFGPIQVPPNNYFVLGDNRDVSLDSRSPEVGLLDKSSIVGKALYIFGSDRDGKKLQ